MGNFAALESIRSSTGPKPLDTPDPAPAIKGQTLPLGDGEDLALLQERYRDQRPLRRRYQRPVPTTTAVDKLIDRTLVALSTVS